MIPIDKEPTVAELCEPIDREWAIWQDFIRREREYEKRHGQDNDGKEV